MEKILIAVVLVGLVLLIWLSFYLKYCWDIEKIEQAKKDRLNKI